MAMGPRFLTAAAYTLKYSCSVYPPMIYYFDLVALITLLREVSTIVSTDHGTEELIKKNIKETSRRRVGSYDNFFQILFPRWIQ